jgi:hypothetical protein
MKSRGIRRGNPPATVEASITTATGRRSKTRHLSLPAAVAKAFTRIGPRLRVEVLSRLLSALGPMALAVIGGGMFAKYIGRARGPEIPVSLEDAMQATSGQILDLVRYVEQSDPAVLHQVVALLSTDIAAMTALGASVAALAIVGWSGDRAQT